ncbi:MAG TPA: GNAT family N-acetyltransferase, partial [Acidimicrobiales bacterium]|nr:GNAT family N-acetyltransferase [Acidimicrobiales bacterium]
MTAVPTGRLGPDAVGAIARLCRRALPEEDLTEPELHSALFGGEAAAVVRGDPEVGVVAAVRRRGEAYIRLLAVDPAHRRRGVATALMDAAEADLAGAGSVTVGADAPDYLFPGVDVRSTEMLCLLEARRYRRVETNLNMGVDLTALPPAPGTSIDDVDRDELAAWMEKHWPHWADEALRGRERGTLLVSRDGEGISGFCAWDVNRGGWLGPIAVRPSDVGRRTGVGLLLDALHRMRASGRDRAEIAWISPVRFYVRTVGAGVSRVFVVHRR